VAAGTRSIAHVDMDAFFASVEQRDNPSLRGQPVLVGARGPRGVVAAASYESRRFGCRSAMPMGRALSLCPGAIICRPRFARYQEASENVFSIFHRYTPLVEGLSLDEAFLDLTGSEGLFGAAPKIAEQIRADIFEETGLTASAGVAPSKFVAKIASDENKPDGLTVVPEDQVVNFLQGMPIKRMWGVGPKAEEALLRRGFRTIGDLAAARPETLEELLGTWGRNVQALASGRDDRPVVVGRRAKSLGAEDTFSTDLRTLEEIERALLSQSTRLAERLVRRGWSARTVTVKLRYRDFQTRSRQKKLDASVADTGSIHETACELLRRFPATSSGIRLSGVSVSDLVEAPPERTLFPEPARERRHRLEQVTAALKDRFGTAAPTRASLLKSDPEGSPISRSLRDLDVGPK